MNHVANIINHPIKDKLEHNGMVYTGTDMVGHLCRDLKEGILEIYRDGKLAMTVNVAKRAKRVLTDTDSRGTMWLKFQEKDMQALKSKYSAYAVSK